MSSIQKKYNFDFINKESEVIEFECVVSEDETYHYIEFGSKKLYKKIAEIGLQSGVDLEIRKFPDCEYLLPAKYCKEFFVGLLRTQSAFEKTISIPPHCVEDTLHYLVNNHFLKNDFAELYKDAVETTCTTLKQYKKLVRGSRDPKKAIELARYYQELQKFDESLIWVRLANDCKDKNNPLSELIDYKGYFQDFTHITEPTLFTIDDEFVLAAAKWSKIESITLFHRVEYSPDIVKRMGRFIENSGSLEDIYLSGYYDDIVPIVDALKKNKTITSFSIRNWEIGQKSIIGQIMGAIDENDELPITKLTINNCRKFRGDEKPVGDALSEVNIQALIKVIMSRPMLKSVEVDEGCQRLINDALRQRDNLEGSLCDDLACMIL